MDVSKLKKDELEYELTIRGIKDLKKVDIMRKRLGTLLSMEFDGKLTPPQVTDFDCEKELSICREKIEIVRGESTWSDLFRVDSLLQHIMNRLNRISFSGDKKVFEDQKSTLLVECTELYEENKSKIESQNDEETYSSAEESDNEGKPKKEKVTIRKKQIPVKNWGIHFSGDGQGISINAFLEAIDELMHARNTSPEELFDSAYDLFRGPALITVRALKRDLKTWNDLVRELKAEFEPQDYEDRLWEEIRRRTQGPNESIGVFAAVIKNYFHRLPTKHEEKDILKIIIKNLQPYYQERLTLQKCDTIAELITLGRQIDESKWRIESHRVPTSGSHLLEPDLSSHLSQPKSNSTSQPQVNEASNSSSPRPSRNCYKCGRTGHIASFCRQQKCYSCGMMGHISPNCSKKGQNSGNSKGQSSQGNGNKKTNQGNSRGGRT